MVLRPQPRWRTGFHRVRHCSGFVDAWESSWPVLRNLRRICRKSLLETALADHQLAIQEQLQTLGSAPRIAIIKPSALGDIVQSLPILEALRLRFPQSKISWVVNQELADLLEGHPALNTVVRFNRRGGWLDQWRLLAKLHSARFDLVLDLQGLLRSAVMTSATGATLRIGMETAREGSNLACDFVVAGTSRDIPAHQRYQEVAWTVLGSRDTLPARIPVSHADSEWSVRELAPLAGTSIVAMHAGAKWVTKRWPAERFAAVAVGASKAGLGIVLVGTKSEQPLSKAIANAVRAVGGKLCDLTGKTTLKQLAAVLGQATAMVSNDSGPMHMAAALGTPIVGVFTCTSPHLSGPAGTQHQLLAAATACAASYKKTCPLQGVAHQACFDTITPERVLLALQNAVSGRVRRVA